MRTLKKITSSQGSAVYMVVNMLKIHLRYKADAEVEDSIRENLERLYRVGNDIINARKRKRDDGNSDVQNSESKEDEKEDLTVFNV